MRYWWVNQNQTYRHEIAGGYLWSPKRKSSGGINPFYETMREVAPGDLVLSFTDTRIAAFGIARSWCYECPKPLEFGSAGMKWDTVGWKVDVRFVELRNRMRPADHMAVLRPHLPTKYSPLSGDGRGSQSVYLTELPPALYQALAALIGPEARSTERVAEDLARSELVTQTPEAAVATWEDHLHEQIARDTRIPETTREAIVQARRGQGLFRQRVAVIEARCRVTGVDKPEHLRASHCKPWRDSTNEERLDGENGLLLTPSIDHLFDRGFISFEGRGRLLVSPVAHVPSLERMGVRTGESVNVGSFSDGQRQFLDWHRDNVFLEAKRARA
jgi:hypothetical protein